MSLPSMEDLGLLLHQYRSDRTLHRALVLHTLMRGQGLDSLPPFGNHILHILVDLCTTESMSTAQQVFDLLLVKDGFSWNCLLLGYVRTGQHSKAFLVFEKMRGSHAVPLDESSALALIEVCAQQKDLERGCRIHDEIANKGLLDFCSSSVIRDCLTNMYLRCGSLSKAEEMFDRYAIQNVVLWTTLITCHVDYGQGEKALACFELMIQMGISPDIITYICVLKACVSIRSLIRGQETYTQIVMIAAECDLVVGSTLIDMYVKCGLLEVARKVFEMLPMRNVVVWNALISGFVDHGSSKEALGFFKKMQFEGIPPDDVTFVCSLKACGLVGAKDIAYLIHTQTVIKAFDKGYDKVANTLVDLYAKRGLFREAEKVFDSIQVCTIVSWNALISGYADHARGEVALVLIKKLVSEGFSPNNVTFAAILKGCGSTAVTQAMLHEIHIEISKKGLDTDVMLGSTLIDTYAKYGLLKDARSVFENSLHRNVVSWNALISGYDEHGCGEEALECFDWMQDDGVSPHVATFVCSIKACGSIGFIDKGQKIHSEAIARGYEEEIFVSNTVVDMYTKCGRFADAHNVFDSFSVQDEISWNALITGFAHVGEHEKVYQSFEKMVRSGMKPDCVTLLAILQACSHAGELDKGWGCFEAMAKNFSISPNLEHYACMVDLLGRSGLVEEAVSWMETMPILPNAVLWHAVLGASRKWSDIDIGKHAFQHAIELDKGDVGAYICMFSIFIDCGMLEEAGMVEAMRVQNHASIKRR